MLATQDMVNNPQTANYRLSLLKTYSIDFKELAEQQQNYVETKININLSKKGTNSFLKEFWKVRVISNDLFSTTNKWI